MKVNKVTAIIRLVISSVVALAAIAVFIMIISSYNIAFIHYSGDPTYVIKDVTISEDVQSLTLNWYIGGIEVIPTDASEIRIVEKAYVNMDYNKSFNSSINNKELTIESRNKAFFNIFNWTVNPSFLQIYLPAGKSLSYVHLNAVSGTFEFSQLITNTFEVNLTSGKLNLDTITSSVLDLTIISGDVDIINSLFDSVDINMTSGDLNYDNVTNRFTADMISGKMTLRFPSRPSAFDLQVTSGTANVSISTDEAFSVALDKTSGSFSSNLVNQDDVYRYLSGGPQYTVDMIAGSVSFRAY